MGFASKIRRPSAGEEPNDQTALNLPTDIAAKTLKRMKEGPFYKNTNKPGGQGGTRDYRTYIVRSLSNGGTCKEPQ